MMNKGKQFEQVIKDAFNKVENCCIIRLQDNMSGFKGVNTICDFIIYKYPYQYFIECKSVHGNILPFSNITKNQWDGMLKMSKKLGVRAGVICWWVDKDVTKFIPIELIDDYKRSGAKSIRYDFEEVGYQTDYFTPAFTLEGNKKRVFFDYNMNFFFNMFET